MEKHKTTPLVGLTKDEMDFLAFVRTSFEGENSVVTAESICTRVDLLCKKQKIATPNDIYQAVIACLTDGGNVKAWRKNRSWIDLAVRQMVAEERRAENWKVETLSSMARLGR